MSLMALFWSLELKPKLKFTESKYQSNTLECNRWMVRATAIQVLFLGKTMWVFHPHVYIHTQIHTYMARQPGLNHVQWVQNDKQPTWILPPCKTTHPADASIDQHRNHGPLDVIWRKRKAICIVSQGGRTRLAATVNAMKFWIDDISRNYTEASQSERGLLRKTERLRLWRNDPVYVADSQWPFGGAREPPQPPASLTNNWKWQTGHRSNVGYCIRVNVSNQCWKRIQ